MDTTNPLTQLADILTTIQTQTYKRGGRGVNVGDAMCWVMMGEPDAGEDYGPEDWTEAYTRVLKILPEARSFIQAHVAARGQERAMSVLNKVWERLTSIGPMSGVPALLHPHFPTEEVQQLATMADGMSGFDTIQVIPADQVAELLKMLNEMEQYVLASSFSDELQARIIGALFELRAALHAGRYTTSKQVMLGMDAVVGVGVRALVSAKTPEETKVAQGFMQRAAGVADFMSKWIDLGAKAAPLGKTILKALGFDQTAD